MSNYMLIENDVVIQVQGLWKRYGLPPAKNLIQGIVRYGKAIVQGSDAMVSGSKWHKEDQGNWALRDINFEVRRGETFGIIGRNGSGKSTLLKILAQTSPATFGNKTIKGRTFSMIELGAGINRELTGRENARLLSTIMGFSPRWIASKMPIIEEFCELGEWFDRPVWQYSSGMTVRLGFGVAVNADADILLVDEVLAVGDLAFQKKCINAINQMQSSGLTTIFVSHNPYQVERLCNRAMLLEKGSIINIGDPADIFLDYFNIVTPAQNLDSVQLSDQQINLRDGSGDLRITDIEFYDRSNEPLDTVEVNKELVIRLHYKTLVPVVSPTIGIRIYNSQHSLVSVLSSVLEKNNIKLHGTGFVDCIIPRMVLTPNLYNLEIKVTSGIVLDVFPNAKTFQIVADPDLLARGANRGVAYLDCQWDYH